MTSRNIWLAWLSLPISLQAGQCTIVVKGWSAHLDSDGIVLANCVFKNTPTDGGMRYVY